MIIEHIARFKNITNARIYIPTPKNNGQRKTDKLVPKQGTSNGSIQALNINSSENGA
jgi:hypothetical protein